MSGWWRALGTTIHANGSTTVWQRGFDTSGIRVVSKKLDLRDFVSYTETLEPSHINPITHFARRGMTFPKTLLGYQPINERKVEEDGVLNVTDIPDHYLTARGALLCPMSLVPQTQLIAGMKRGQVHTFVLTCLLQHETQGAQGAACSPEWRYSLSHLPGGIEKSVLG